MTGVRVSRPPLARQTHRFDRELTFDITHCPGHSPGGVMFFGRVRFAHVGDVLFNGSVAHRSARRQLPPDQSITQLLPLGDDVLHLRSGAGSSIQNG